MTPSVFSAEGLSGVVFLVFVAATVAGALIATNARRLIRSVAGLALAFVGVAGIYYYLGSPFVALMQVLIYVGAVCVTIIFAIMLAETTESKLLASRSPFFIGLGVVASAAIVWALWALGRETPWKPAASQSGGGVEELGKSLLTSYGMSFELISVVLLVAIIGALVLARRGRSGS
uniref:NADH-quinone oxidoreductase subunit J n=1 Tax=Fundidesulfovibrio putealis TaxID=270496 RepID=A0A7C4EHV9_9BACT